MNFKKWVKSIQTAGYNGTRTVSLSHSAFKVDASKTQTVMTATNLNLKLSENMTTSLIL